MGRIARLRARLGALARGTNWVGPIVLGSSALLAVLLSLFFGFIYEQQPLPINTDRFDVLAGVVIGALAIERLTELLIAPWVGSVSGRSNRVAIIGAAAILLGVTVAGGLGLRLLDALTSSPLGDGDGFDDGLARSADILITGLAIGGGTKPLHDLLSRLGHGVQRVKNKDITGVKVVEADLLDGDEAPAMIELLIRPSREAVPLGEAGRAARRSDARGLPRTAAPTSPAFFTAAIRALWPTSVIPSIGPGIPDEVSISVPTRYRPDTDSFVREAFSLAHSGVASGLQTTPVLGVPNDDPSSEFDPRAAAAPRRWALEQLRVDRDVMRQAKGGSGVRVAHLDTGYREHELAPEWELEDGFDFLDQDDDPREPDRSASSAPLDLDLDVDLMRSTFHGTGTGSVIAGPGEGELYSETWWSDSRVIGVAPEASVVPIRVMRGPVHLFDDEVARAVKHAHERGCAVISMALGGYGFVGLREAIDDAVADGVIVVAAAGNQVNSVVDPAAFPNVVAVANSTLAGSPNTAESSSGPAVNVTAPGTEVWRAAFDEDGSATAGFGTGTSYSVSHVAGVAALWLSQHGRDELVTAYGNDNVPRLFAHLLTTTAQDWPDEWKNMGWGAGLVDTTELLNTAVMDATGGATIPIDNFADALIGDEPESGVNRLTATVASVFSGQATTAFREKIVRFVGGSVARRQGVDDPFGPPESTVDEPGVPPLVTAEFRLGLARDPKFAEPEVLETKASPQLRQLVSELAPTANDSRWGNGLSLPLRRLLIGARPSQLRMRWAGLAALVVSTAIAFLVGWPRDASALGVVGSLSVLGVGIYVAAQAIERFLELAVGPFVFRDQPERQAERALIMLGTGVLIGTVVSLVTGVYIFESLATGVGLDETPSSVRILGKGEGNPSLLRSLDVLVTGLVIGGGAKPIHDLIERIQVTAEQAKDEPTT